MPALLSIPEGKPAQWICGPCMSYGDFVLTPCENVYCNSSKTRHFSWTKTFIYDFAKFDNPETVSITTFEPPVESQLNTPPSGQGLYGLYGASREDNWLCEECRKKGLVQLNGPWQHLCRSLDCDGEFDPLREIGGWLKWICARCIRKAITESQESQESQASQGPNGPQNEVVPVKINVGIDCPVCNFSFDAVAGRGGQLSALLCKKNDQKWHTDSQWMCTVCSKEMGVERHTCHNSVRCPGSRDNGIPYIKLRWRCSTWEASTDTA